jgi:SAM-dependent methyltransferase
MDIKSWEAYCTANVTAGYTPGGKARNIPSSGKVIVEFLQKLGILQDGVSILDVGAGNGRLAIGLHFSTLRDYSYHGLEIIKPCVEFCQLAFNNEPHFRFSHLDIYNAHYWPNGTQKPLEAIYPVESASTDVVIANSVFTHVANSAEAAHYLNEMLRVLKPDGTLYATWSFTTMRNAMAINPKHTVWHFSTVLALLNGLDYHFLSLENDAFPNWHTITGAPNQVAIVVTKR